MNFTSDLDLAIVMSLSAAAAEEEERNIAEAVARSTATTASGNNEDVPKVEDDLALALKIYEEEQQAEADHMLAFLLANDASFSLPSEPVLQRRNPQSNTYSSNTQHSKAITSVARTIASNFQNQSKPSTNVRDLMYDQNVHHTDVENPAIQSLKEFAEEPLPDNLNANDMITDAKNRILNLRNLSPQIAHNAVELLSDESILRLTYKGCNYKQCFAAVWNKVIRHKNCLDIIPIVADELSASVDSNICPGGKFVRLVNSLQGFVNIGCHDVELGRTQAFQSAFSSVATKSGLSDDERRKEAVIVLDEYGITGKVRDEWLASLNDL
jgi:hypothetical protein